MASVGPSGPHGTGTPQQPMGTPNLANYSRLVRYILQPVMHPPDPAWKELLVGFGSYLLFNTLIVLGNALSIGQAITWTNGDIWSTGPLGANQRNLDQITYIYIILSHENA